MTENTFPASVIGEGGVGGLIAALAADGYQVVGPRVDSGAIVYAPIDGIDDLPRGYSDTQDGGTYRLLADAADGALFDWVVGPQSWKTYLYPPEQLLWRATRRGRAFKVEAPAEAPPRYALFGARPCEVAAIAIHDKVFDNGDFTDPGYKGRRDAAFVVAVNCRRAGGTCFCASMDTGPRAHGGFDLALTELKDDARHEFLVEVGSPRGAAIFEAVERRDAGPDDRAAADAAIAKAMGRTMVADPDRVLKRAFAHPRWEEVAKRCLNCANCTMVCPTCFCTTVEDVTDLTGSNAERWRKWDSCFTVDFSYIHGGPIRRDAHARYRQWMTHKLLHWHDQFGTSGCVGCGRCITWCPVGIDITEETRAIRDSEGRP